MMDWTYTDQINGVGDPIDFEVFAELKSNILEAAGTDSAASTFNGPTGRSVTIADQGSTDYIVMIVPSADSGGNIGEWWVVNDSGTQFTVYCSGTATTAFRYKVLR